MEHEESLKMNFSKKKLIYFCAVLLCVLGIAASGFMIIHKLLQAHKNERQLEGLARLVQADTGTEGVLYDRRGAEAEELTKEEVFAACLRERKERLAEYQKLKEQNSDMKGWITIPGTRIDYPVMQTPAQPEYYLKHDFEKQKSSYGLPFLGGACDLSKRDGNLVIYGHHMKNGSMFAGLMGYIEQEFYEQHPYIWFDTLEEPGVYQITGVIKESALNQDPTLFQLAEGSGKENFERFMEEVRKRSFYDTGYTASYGEQLLILMTCEYSQKEGRLMVIAGRREAF